jgi:hypothetical protein
MRSWASKARALHESNDTRWVLRRGSCSAFDYPQPGAARVVRSAGVQLDAEDSACQ